MQQVKDGKVTKVKDQQKFLIVYEFHAKLFAVAEENLKALKKEAHLAKRYKAVTKALINLADNPKHPSLQTHEYHSSLAPVGRRFLKPMQRIILRGRIEFYFIMAVSVVKLIF